MQTLDVSFFGNARWMDYDENSQIDTELNQHSAPHPRFGLIDALIYVFMRLLPRAESATFCSPQCQKMQQHSSFGENKVPTYSVCMTSQIWDFLLRIHIHFKMIS